MSEPESKPAMVWNGSKGHWEDSAEAEKRRQDSLARPFDPREEISADAQHIASKIVKHMWIIFVLLPAILGVIFMIVKQVG